MNAMWADESAGTGSPPSAAPLAPSSGCVLLARAATIALSLVIATWAPPALAICRPVAITPMTFTNFSPLGARVSATATLTYRCTGRTTSADLTLSTPWTMSSAGVPLAFELFTDTGTTPFPGPPGLSLRVRNNGRVTIVGYLSPQDVAPGTYTTSLTATITSNRTTARSMAFTVSTTFLGTCEIQPATLAFGEYDPFATSATDAEASLAIQCTRNTPYAIALGMGNNPAGGIRQLAGPSNGRLQYELSSDALRTTPWDLIRTVTGTTPTTAPVAIPVYGRIPSGQFQPVGAYTDLVQSTINF